MQHHASCQKPSGEFSATLENSAKMQSGWSDRGQAEAQSFFNRPNVARVSPTLSRGHLRESEYKAAAQFTSYSDSATESPLSFFVISQRSDLL